MARYKKIIKKKPAREKIKLVPSKTAPGVLDVISKSKPARKIIKKKKKRKADSLPPHIVRRPKPKRKIPKDVTKRTPKAAPKRKVPKRKSAVERERRVQFAKEHPLMQRKPKPRSPSARDMMLLSPIGGPVSHLIGKGAKKLLQNKRVKEAAKKLGKKATTGFGGLKPRNRKKPSKRIY